MEEEVEQEEQERDAVNRRSIPLKRPDCCYRCRWRKFPKKNLRIIGNDESIRLILIFFRININDTSTASVINHDWTNVEIIQLRNSLQTLKKRYQHLKTKKKVLFWRGSARWLHYPILWWHSRNTMNESSWFFCCLTVSHQWTLVRSYRKQAACGYPHVCLSPPRQIRLTHTQSATKMQRCSYVSIYKKN